MKHNLTITLLLLVFFLLAQFIGLGLLYHYIDQEKSAAEGKTIYFALPVGERPPLEEKSSYFPIMVAILIGTGLLFILLKFGLILVWRIWFLLAVTMSLTMVIGAYLKVEIAFVLSLFLGLWKIFKPNFWIQNLTELFIYGGLAVIFVPVFNLWSISILVVIIAIYDAYAVWKSKHMITLALSQSKAKIFAGLYMPYRLTKAKKSKTISSSSKLSSSSSSTTKSIKKVPSKIRTAVLGGGDIAFPLFFAGVVMKELGLWQSLVIPFFALAGLGFLLWYGDENKFYPAMPFIGGSCLVGLGVVLLIQLVI